MWIRPDKKLSIRPWTRKVRVIANVADETGMRRPHKWLFGALALGVVAAGLWLLSGPREEPPLARHPAVAPSLAAESPEPALDATPERSAAREPPYYGELRPAEVLGNLECDMVPGWGAATGTALVVVPHGQGAKFSVVDRDGAVFGDTVPFRPNRYSLGRREDGTPLVGLGTLNRNFNQFRSPDSPEPVYIYMGRQLIYESNKAWEFLIARDASSFVVHEPSGGGTSRLAVRDLARGEERHIDLGTRLMSVHAYESGLFIDYALGDQEIIVKQLEHSDSRGIGTYWFYPVGEGRSQRITIKGGSSVLVVSSREAYFMKQPDEVARRGVWRITKRRLDVSAGTTEDLWSNVLDLRGGGDLRTISDDGRWLGVDGWDFHVLNAESGESVFKYPRDVGNEDRQLAMLSSVLGPDASPVDIGTLTNIAFRGNGMWFRRHFGWAECSPPPGEEYDAVRYRQCVRDHRERGLYKAVYDMYDLDTLAADSQPAYRTEIFRETSCMEGNMPLRGLQNVDGKLTYLTEGR